VQYARDTRDTPGADRPGGSTPFGGFGPLGAFAVAVIAVGYLAGCAPSVTREPAPTISDTTVIANAVNRLCYAFNGYTVDDLDRPVVEGDVDYLAGLQGVPGPLAANARFYWDDARVRDLTVAANRAEAEARRGTVITSCRTYGWKGAPASDQPPRK
jgi:hypothetical protein